MSTLVTLTDCPFPCDYKTTSFFMLKKSSSTLRSSKNLLNAALIIKIPPPCSKSGYPNGGVSLSFSLDCWCHEEKSLPVYAAL